MMRSTLKGTRPAKDVGARTCENCRYCLLADHGYSNYTTEGTYVYCLLRLHPDPGFDRWYLRDARLDYALQCDRYLQGEPVHVDVERENFTRKLGYGYAKDLLTARL